MGRRRSTGRVVRRGKRPGKWMSPREQFIFSLEPVSVAGLAKMWMGYPQGCSEKTMQKKCNEGRWREKRKEYQARVMEETTRKFQEKDSDNRTEMLKKSFTMHVKEGQALQRIGMEVLVKVRNVIAATEDGGMKPSEALRAISQVVSKGVEIERKGLGIADRVEVEYRTTEIVREVIQVLEVIITDPDVMAEAVYRLQQIGKKDREELQRITAGGEVE